MSIVCPSWPTGAYLGDTRHSYHETLDYSIMAAPMPGRRSSHPCECHPASSLHSSAVKHYSSRPAASLVRGVAHTVRMHDGAHTVLRSGPGHRPSALDRTPRVKHLTSIAKAKAQLCTTYTQPTQCTPPPSHLSRCIEHNERPLNHPRHVHSKASNAWAKARHARPPPPITANNPPRPITGTSPRSFATPHQSPP